VSSIATVIAIALLAAACGLGLRGLAAARTRRRDAQLLSLLATFGPAVERAQSDPRVLLAWYPIAERARQAFPDAFTDLDREGATRFPFDAGQLEAAHAQWSADWLTWERNHATEYRLKRDAMSGELERSGDVDDQAARAQLETLEREKLERYQRRYEEYVRVSRALASLGAADDGGAASVD